MQSNRRDVTDAELAALREKVAAALKDVDGIVTYHHAIQMYQTELTNDDTTRLRELYGHTLDCRNHINEALAIIDGPTENKDVEV